MSEKIIEVWHKYESIIIIILIAFVLLYIMSDIYVPISRQLNFDTYYKDMNSSFRIPETEKIITINSVIAYASLTLIGFLLMLITYLYKRGTQISKLMFFYIFMFTGAMTSFKYAIISMGQLHFNEITKEALDNTKYSIFVFVIVLCSVLGLFIYTNLKEIIEQKRQE